MLRELRRRRSTAAKPQECFDVGRERAWRDLAGSGKFVRAGNALENGVSTPLPGAGQRLFLGNATYGVFKGPASGIEDFNASLNKDFKVVENYKFNFHAEAINVLNHTVLNGPGYNNTVGPDTEGFGIISTANAPRNIQLSLHFIF